MCVSSVPMNRRVPYEGDQFALSVKTSFSRYIGILVFGYCIPRVSHLLYGYDAFIRAIRSFIDSQSWVVSHLYPTDLSAESVQCIAYKFSDFVPPILAPSPHLFQLHTPLQFLLVSADDSLSLFPQH